MKSFKKAFKEQDLYYTPKILVEILKPFLEKYVLKDKIILCPFDTQESEYVKCLTNWGYTVKFGSLETGEDFFKYDYGDYDIVISNPPFSKKKHIYKKLFELNKPFFLLGNLMQINYQEIGELFFNKEPQVQMIIPDKKVSFDGNTSSFCSGYFCWNIIPKTEYVHISHNNSKRNYGLENSYSVNPLKNCQEPQSFKR